MCTIKLKKPNLSQGRGGKPRVSQRWPGCQLLNNELAARPFLCEWFDVTLTDPCPIRLEPDHCLVWLLKCLASNQAL